jgi:hypothetical protein
LKNFNVYFFIRRNRGNSDSLQTPNGPDALGSLLSEKLKNPESAYALTANVIFWAMGKVVF